MEGCGISFMEGCRNVVLLARKDNDVSVPQTDDHVSSVYSWYYGLTIVVTVTPTVKKLFIMNR